MDKDNPLYSKIKKRLRKFGLSTLFAATLLTNIACAPNISARINYRSPIPRNNSRVGIDIMPYSARFYKDLFQIEGYSPTIGREVIVYESVDRTNHEILNEVKQDLSYVIRINNELPAGHPEKTVYVSGYYQNKETGPILDMETININGELYFTDPIDDSRLYFNVGFEFWNYDWWRWHIHAHYPTNFTPWWDINRDGIFLDYYSPIDWDRDGISNWNESMIGTNIYNPDTDYDGLDDLVEIWLGTNPRNPDTDYDGYYDGYDPFPLWPARFHRNLGYSSWSIWWHMNQNHYRVKYKHETRQRFHVPPKEWVEHRTPTREYKLKLKRKEDQNKKRYKVISPKQYESGLNKREIPKQKIKGRY